MQHLAQSLPACLRPCMSQLDMYTTAWDIRRQCHSCPDSISCYLSSLRSQAANQGHSCNQELLLTYDVEGRAISLHLNSICTGAVFRPCELVPVAFDSRGTDQLIPLCAPRSVQLPGLHRGGAEGHRWGRVVEGHELAREV